MVSKELCVRICNKAYNPDAHKRTWVWQALALRVFNNTENMLDLYIKQLINVDFRWGKLTFITTRKTGRHKHSLTRTYIHIHTYSHVGAHSQPFSTHLTHTDRHTHSIHTFACALPNCPWCRANAPHLIRDLIAFGWKFILRYKQRCRCVVVSSLPCPAQPSPDQPTQCSQASGSIIANRLGNARLPFRPSAQASRGFPAPTTWHT